jgi:GTP-binding protein
MEIIYSDYIASYNREEQCPKGEVAEIAFIGRSNVGKSSLINMLCNKKELAKVSKEPGKTQMMNFFIINNTWHLVDLPGYGYAKISQKTRASWVKMINYYLLNRAQLRLAFVLIDARHPLQKIDLDFINWMGSNQIPMAIVYTKVDKLKQSELKPNIARIQDELAKYWDNLPTQFISSAEKSTGKEEILDFIAEIVNK